MAKDPAFLFYPNDFTSGTQFFTNEEVGIYIRLLCAQHQHGRLSKKHMLFICGTLESDVVKKFELDKDGNYYNVRLEEEIEKRQKYSKSRSDNRLGKKNQPIKENNISLSYVNHMENENVNENKDKNKDIEERKEEFIENVHKLILTNDLTLINTFVLYWTESSRNGKKMRFEGEKYFDIKKRFKTFENNQKKWDNGKSTTTTVHF